MLFDPEIKRCCAFCEHSSDLDDRLVLCSLKGPVDFDFCCRHYRYDPLRRIPRPPANPSQKKFSKEDFVQEMKKPPEKAAFEGVEKVA